MRRVMLMLSLTAMLVVSAVPVASAQDRDDRRENRFEDRLENRLDRFDDGFFFTDRERFDNDGFFFTDGDRFDNDGFFFVGDRFNDGDFDRFDFDGFDFDGDVEGISQDFEQETESGDVDQSFEISGDGDNASQCVNVSGVSNTGNVQDTSGFVSFDSDIDDIEQHDIGS